MLMLVNGLKISFFIFPLYIGCFGVKSCETLDTGTLY